MWLSFFVSLFRRVWLHLWGIRLGHFALPSPPKLFSRLQFKVRAGRGRLWRNTQTATPTPTPMRRPTADASHEWCCSGKNQWQLPLPIAPTPCHLLLFISCPRNVLDVRPQGPALLLWPTHELPGKRARCRPRTQNALIVWGIGFHVSRKVGSTWVARPLEFHALQWAVAINERPGKYATQ